MRITTGLVLSLLGVCAAAQAGQPPALACNPKALTRAARPRYQEISRRLREAVRDREKLPNGYALSLDGKAISLTEAAEWMSLDPLLPVSNTWAGSRLRSTRLGFDANGTFRSEAYANARRNHSISFPRPRVAAGSRSAGTEAPYDRF